MENIENKKTKTNWETVKDIAKASIFSTLLAFASPGGVSAGEKVPEDFRDAVRQSDTNDMRDSVADYKTMTEQFRREIIKKQSLIKDRAYKEGKIVNFDGEQVRQIVTEGGDTILVGNNFLEDKTWISLTTPNKLTYLSNEDGMVEAAFVNMEEANEDKDLSDDVAKTKLDIEMASVMTGTYFKLMNKKKFHFIFENGNYAIEALDMKTGKKMLLEGSKANELVKDIFAYYLEHLNNIN